MGPSVQLLYDRIEHLSPDVEGAVALVRLLIEHLDECHDEMEGLRLELRSCKHTDEDGA